MDDLRVGEEQWWWIDFLENELDPGLERDLQSLLEHSQEDRDSFESFRLLREWLRASDPVAAWPVEDRVARMRAGVMNAITDFSAVEEPSYRAALSLDTKSLSV